MQLRTVCVAPPEMCLVSLASLKQFFCFLSCFRFIIAVVTLLACRSKRLERLVKVRDAMDGHLPSSGLSRDPGKWAGSQIGTLAIKRSSYLWARTSLILKYELLQRSLAWRPPCVQEECG